VYWRLREGAKIVAFSIGAAIVYGVLHDLVTAHVCVEYFTVAHPQIVATESPVILALVWGIIATWWVGLPLGLLLAIASLLGAQPIAFADIRRGVVRLMLTSAVLALTLGAVGAISASQGLYPLTEHWNEILPADRWVPFAFDAWAHLTSYASGVIGGLTLVSLIVLRRLRSGG
jgi:hypothetical protein